MRKIILFLLLIMTIFSLNYAYADEYDLSYVLDIDENDNVNCIKKDYIINDFVYINDYIYLALGKNMDNVMCICKINIDDKKCNILYDEDDLADYKVTLFSDDKNIVLKKENQATVLFEYLLSEDNSNLYELSKDINIDYVWYNSEIYFISQNCMLCKIGKNNDVEIINDNLSELFGIKVIDGIRLFSCRNGLFANAYCMDSGECKIANVIDKKLLNACIYIDKLYASDNKTIIIGEDYFPAPWSLPTFDQKNYYKVTINESNEEKINQENKNNWHDIAFTYQIENDKSIKSNILKDKLSLYVTDSTNTTTRYSFFEDYNNESNINIYLEESKLQFSKYPIIKNDRTLVPLRGFATYLGAEVVWDSKEKSITISKDDDKIKFTIGKLEYLYNDTVYKNDIAPEIIDGKTMIPLRLVVEILKYNCLWDNGTIYITK